MALQYLDFLALVANFLNLLGSFFAILTGTYDTNALWNERYLSGSTEDHYWHVLCWSLDEYGRAVFFCRFIFIVALLAFLFAVYRYRQNCGHAAGRRALESELEACRKGRIEDGIKIQDLDTENKRLKDQSDDLEKDLADLKDQATITAENDAQIIQNANDRADDFEEQLDDALKTNEQLEEKVKALEETDETAQTYIKRLENELKTRGKKLETQHKEAEALEDQVGKILREKTDATRQYNKLQVNFVAEERAKNEEKEKATKAKAVEGKATQEASTLRKDLRAEKALSKKLEHQKNDAIDDAKRQCEDQAAVYNEQSNMKDAKARAQTQQLQQKNNKLETLRNDLEEAKQQTLSYQTELENVTNEKTELQKHSEDAATDAARRIEQLQQQISEHKTLQDEIKRMESEHESLHDELEKAKIAAEQTKELQQERETQHRTVQQTNNAREAKIQPLQQHDNETIAALQNEMATIQTRAIQAEKASEDAAKSSETTSQEIENMRTEQNDSQMRLRGAELKIESLNTALQVAEGRREIMAQALETAMDRNEELTAQLSNVDICKRYLRGECRYSDEKCRQQHPIICDKKYCPQEGRGCAKYHRQKPMVCGEWSATGRCDPPAGEACRLPHPKFCREGRRCDVPCRYFHPPPTG